MSIRNTISQIWPPAATFTEKDVPDMAGKVCIVTGANTGVGKEVARILFDKNATVYAAGRSEEKTLAAVASIKDAAPSSAGRIEFLKLDLGDLSTIKASAAAFIGKESQLHLLINNAGVMAPPAGSTTAQGYEMQLGTNCVGPFLFTKLLTPALVATAKTAAPGAVRVVWVSSSAADGLAPTGGLDIDNLDYKHDRYQMTKYAISKAGNYFHATEFARRHRVDGITSVALNPGNLRSDLDRHISGLGILIRKATTYPTVYGAYTELFAATSPDVTLERSGDWIAPWGRFLPIRADIAKGALPESEGGSGIAQKFWEWSEAQVKAYA